jgi:spore coat protein U-like protein
MKLFRTAAATVVILVAVAVDARASCSLSSNGMAFGVYNVFNTAPVDSTATIALVCTKKTKKDDNIRVTLGRSLNGSFTRALRSGANQLSYNLYLDATRSAIWGDGTSGTVQYRNANPRKNEVINITVYGRIPAGQDAVVGTYNDSIVLTVLF